MNRTLYAILMFAWALWMGGMVMLVIFVMRLFQTSHELGATAAPVLFRTFAFYQLLIGMIACAAGAILGLRTRRKLHAVMTLLMTLALCGGLILHRWTYRMEDLRADGQSQGTEFKSLHVKSTRVYQTALILLLAAGIGWTVTGPSAAPLRTKQETVPA